MKEALALVDPVNSPRPGRLDTFLERRRPTIEAGSVANIDFVDMYERFGLTTYLFDRDGTLTDYHSSIVPNRIKANMARDRQILKERGVDLRFGVMTNTPPSDDESFIGLNYVAQQIDAEIVLVPETKGEAKPSQVLPLKGIDYFYSNYGTQPSEIAVVGDKLTADMLAAENTGLIGIHVDHKKAGTRDHVGDKLGRRPYEAGLEMLMGPQPSQIEFPELSPAVKRLMENRERGGEVSMEEVVFDASKPDWVTDEIQPIWDNSRIAGFGAASITLPQEVLDELPSSKYGKIIEQTVKAIEKIDPKFGDRTETVSEAVRSVFYEYGGDLADAMVFYRGKIAGPAAASALLRGKNTQAFWWAVSAGLSDLFDGAVARGSKRGATPEGAKGDNEADKNFALILKAALLATGRMEQEHFDEIVGSDNEMKNEARPEAERQGIRTPAVEAGKEASAIDFVTDLFSITRFADRHPRLRSRFKKYAVKKKKERIEISKREWIQRHQEFEEGKAVLLSQAELTLAA